MTDEEKFRSNIVNISRNFDKVQSEKLPSRWCMFFANRYNRKENDKFKYQSRIIVQENDGLYRWLMQYSDQVKVIQPLKIREELKKRYEKALKDLNL